MVTVKKVGVECIPIIQSLANTTWAIAYKEILSARQMSYMLQQIYSSGSLQNQLENLGHQFVLATTENEAVGFASYSVKDKGDQHIYKLYKIYIDPNQQGKGIGKILLDHILHTIIPMGAKLLELNVNRQNKALGFYQKLGFKITGEQNIPIGNNYFMNDYIMQLVL